MMHLPERIQMDLTPWQVPGLVSLGRSDYYQAQGVLGEHTHQGCAEICYLGRGRQDFRIAGTLYSMRGGDILFSSPDEVHSSAGEPMERSLLYWLIIDLTVPPDRFMDLPPAEAAPLCHALRQQKNHLFRAAEQAGELLEEMTQAQLADGQFFQRTRLRLLIVRFLMEVATLSPQLSQKRYNPKIAAALERIEKKHAYGIGLERIAWDAGMSLSHFKMRFQKEVGIPPAEYCLRRTLEHAKRMLAENQKTITQIAYELNFSSSQYFATVFKRYTGHRPGEYRRHRQGH